MKKSKQSNCKKKVASRIIKRAGLIVLVTIDQTESLIVVNGTDANSFENFHPLSLQLELLKLLNIISSTDKGFDFLFECLTIDVINKRVKIELKEQHQNKIVQTCLGKIGAKVAITTSGQYLVNKKLHLQIEKLSPYLDIRQINKLKKKSLQFQKNKLQPMNNLRSTKKIKLLQNTMSKNHLPRLNSSAASNLQTFKLKQKVPKSLPVLLYKSNKKFKKQNRRIFYTSRGQARTESKIDQSQKKLISDQRCTKLNVPIQLLQLSSKSRSPDQIQSHISSALVQVIQQKVNTCQLQLIQHCEQLQRDQPLVMNNNYLQFYFCQSLLKLNLDEKPIPKTDKPQSKNTAKINPEGQSSLKKQKLPYLINLKESQIQQTQQSYLRRKACQQAVQHNKQLPLNSQRFKQTSDGQLKYKFNEQTVSNQQSVYKLEYIKQKFESVKSLKWQQLYPKTNQAVGYVSIAVRQDTVQRPVWKKAVSLSQQRQERGISRLRRSEDQFYHGHVEVQPPTRKENQFLCKQNKIVEIFLDNGGAESGSKEEIEN